MKMPGPDHPITIEPARTRVTVKFNGRVIVDSTNALALREANYPPVYYIPMADVNPGVLQRTTHHTHCPYKGDASYFSIVADGKTAENAVWSYENPFPAMAGIAGHVAFYPNKVEIVGTNS
jgi:uncharacterized protein (DUF427 family)